MKAPSPLRTVFLILAAIFATGTVVRNVPAQHGVAGEPIRLKSREFIPAPGLDKALSTAARRPRHSLIQFYRIPTLSERDALLGAGVNLFTYIPNRAFLARLPADVGPVMDFSIVRYVGPLRLTDKIDARILHEGVNSFAKNPDGTLRLSVLFFEDVPIDEAAAVVKAHGGHITETLSDFHLIRADVPEISLTALLAEDAVKWVEDVFEDQLLNDQVRAAMRVDLVQAAPYSLRGTGVVLGEWDPSHAIGAGDVTHGDLEGRVTRGDFGTHQNYHAFHVAGTAIGTGLLSDVTGNGTPFQFKGMAPDATLISYDSSSFLGEYAAAIGTHHVDLSTNSWHQGGGGYGGYMANTAALDQIITGSEGRRIPIFWAAGNQRRAESSGLNLCDRDLDGDRSTLYDGYDCIVNLGAAKNTVTVGAINANDDSMTDFSSWGPTNDGRLKPEIVAPGCAVSTGESDTYLRLCGTSMATPASAGSTALLLQRFRQLCPSSGDPLPSTVKALLIHGARDLDDGTAWNTRGPDFASGYGRLDLPRSVDLVPFHVEDVVPHLGVKGYPIVVTAQQDLKITLVWDDPAAAPNAAVTLISDLDLELVDPLGGIHRPWVLDPASPTVPATRGVDRRNIVEQVVVDSVDSTLAGTWTIRVKGTNVPDLTQPFSLVSELLASTSCSGPAIGADIWGADTPLDTGVEPNTDEGPMWISDDIRVRLGPVDGPHENPEAGQTNYVFISVRNRGTQTGPYARVFLYWANASTGLGWPSDWNQINTATAVNVPATSSTVVGPIPWIPKAAGHYCLYVRMITHNEPTGSEDGGVNSSTKLSNQIIWKNLEIFDVLSDAGSEFIFRNPRWTTGNFTLAFENPPEQLDDPFLNHGQIFIDLGMPLYVRWKHFGGRQRGLSPVEGTVFRVVDPQRAEIVGIPLMAREQFTVGISFSAKELPLDARYRFDVIQRSELGGMPEGGVSYRLEAGPQRP